MTTEPSTLGSPDSHDAPLELTPSADDILEVSPVNSHDEDTQKEENSLMEETRAMQRRLAAEAARPRTRIAGDAFSSSSSEDEGQPGHNGRCSNVHRPQFSQSEFDKALMTGIPSKGAASFEQGDFLSQADNAAMQEATSVEGSSETGEKRQHRRQQQPTSVGHHNPSQLPPPPPPPLRNTLSTTSSQVSDMTSSTAAHRPVGPPRNQRRHRPTQEDIAAGVLPDVLMTMRQKIESLTLFDSDMMKLAEGDFDDRIFQETRESLKRSSQQSLSAAVLVSLAHKRYERRRLAAMEIEKVVRSLVQQDELDRVRAILLLLSDDYVRSRNEDARKGGVVALAACAIGLKKANEAVPEVSECRDLILASVVHACQDHFPRVRYYATESLFNVVKAIPALAVQHFFILFEILRSLYADVEVDVRSGAEMLDKKLKEVIVGAINSGSFSAEACVPIFARFVYMRNKATKRLTLLWLQELNEKLIGTPVLEFLHLFLGGIFAMIADPSISIRQSALAFLQSVLPKLLVDNEAFEDEGASMKIDFDKLIQSLVTTLEHPDPFVRKVAMYWMSRIVRAHIGDSKTGSKTSEDRLTAASASVRNSLPHVLPGVLLSIGDSFHSKTTTKDTFLPDQTTYSLAEQTNTYLQDAVRRDGKAYVVHLDGFIMALREELDTSGGLQSRNPPAVERKPYRMDVAPDGTGIESTGWFRMSSDTKPKGDSSMMSRLCALQWVVVLYESVVPDKLKAEYAREFIMPIIHQLVDGPPELIIFKSLEVLAKITVPVAGEKRSSSSHLLTGKATTGMSEEISHNPMSDASIRFALEILDESRGQCKSRDREVFSVLIRLNAFNQHLLGDLSRVIQFMCTLQPPEFVFVSFAVELNNFAMNNAVSKSSDEKKQDGIAHTASDASLLDFVSSFVQQMSHVLLNAEEAREFRDLLQDCIGYRGTSERDLQRTQLFHILLHTFSHNFVSSISLCLWAGAFRTASRVVRSIHPLDVRLVFLLELDRLVELLERPLLRHLHLRMLEGDDDPQAEGSGAMLFLTLKSLLMVLPQTTCYNVLRDRLVTVSKFRQSAIRVSAVEQTKRPDGSTDMFVGRVMEVRRLHCDARWQSIRSESLETPAPQRRDEKFEPGVDRRAWLGYETKEQEDIAKRRFADEKQRLKSGVRIEEIRNDYHDFTEMEGREVKTFRETEEPSNRKSREANEKEDEKWEDFWMQKQEEEQA